MLKKIKSLFIVEEEDKSPKPKNKVNQPTPTSNTKSTPSKTFTTPAATGGKATKKFTDVLLNALEENNIDGFDYMEYKRSLESLKKMSMDEGTRYQSAFAMAQTMGVSAPDLINSTQHYINVLVQEEKKFQQAVSNQQSSQIKAKEEEIKNLGATIKSKEEQIKQLQIQIDQHKKDMEKMQSSISGEAAKIQATKSNFLASYQLLLSQIQADHENMKKYLK